MFDSDDLEFNVMKEENIKSSSDQFPLKTLTLPNFQGKIVSMSSSKKYLYFITDIGELFRLKSGDLSSLNQAHKIRPESSKSFPPFKEKLIKIWTDIEGNHSIIRYKNSIYYFNSECGIVKELNKFKEHKIEIFAVGFDETNTNVFKTGNILISDYNNNIYEYCITIDNVDRDDFSFKDKITFLDSLIYQDWDKEEEDESIKECDSNSRIYGIKFYRTNFKPNNLSSSQNQKDVKVVINNCYIILVSKNKMFQLRGQCENNSFKSLFEKYKKNHALYNESCKYFPEENKSKNDFIDFDINILHNQYNKYEKFGWRSQCGFVYGDFEYGSDYTPDDIIKSIFVPFTKITQDGKKVNDEPINVVHSINHIFVLYKDCLTIISKINTNIIHTQYLTKPYSNIFYNQFSEKNGNLILVSKEGGVYNIPLEKENINIWQDYIEIGNYEEAVNICEKINPGLIKKIRRASAEEFFYEKGRGYKAAKDFSLSDEQFETVCILFLMKNDFKNLKKYLTDYSANNLDNQKNITQFMLVTFLLFNIHLKENKKIIQKNDLEENPLNKENIALIEQNKNSLENFSNFIKENKDFLNPEMVYQILQNNGRMEEYILYASLMQDYDKVILYYINEKNVPKALHELTQFAHSSNKEESLKKLCNIFQQNAPLFFKQSPKESISLVKEKFQKFVDMEIIIRSIVNMTDKDDFGLTMDGKEFEKLKIKNDLNEKEENEKKEIKKKNDNEILSYLRSLIGKKEKNMKEERNVHNLYIYYLSKTEENQEELLEYLKTPLNNKDNIYSIYKKNKGPLFQLDYAKKLLRNNPEALSLVLALMGKHSDGVNLALKTNTKRSIEIAKFIAANTQNEKLKKKLWTDIFCDNKQSEKDPIKIMKESKILKIEDVLPYISDEIKIEDFKTQISKSINEYEENINHLKEDINNYNKANEVIINEIYKINKKSTEIKYSECKCDICHKIIKNKNIYLFPCGHIFDAICIKKCLKNYEKEGVKQKTLIEKNNKIAELFKKLKINEENDKVKEEGNEKKDLMGMGQIFSKIINYGKEVVNKTKEFNSDKMTNKEIEEEQKKLNELLSEQCVFCGEYLVENVQNSLIDEEKDAIEWAYS